MAKDKQFLRPRLRLFLSADIVGSTALKQSANAALGGLSALDWFPILQGFYLETQRSFLGNWDRLANGTNAATVWGPRPELWKIIGDEILFTKELTHHQQVQSTLSCWIDAIEDIRQVIRKAPGAIDIKCTAWTAGFPVMNKEIALLRDFDPASPPVTNYLQEAARLLDERYTSTSKSVHAKTTVDYIGPSIDIGFRLCQYADRRKFIISVGVAYILTYSNKKTQAKKVGDLRYDGSVVLKGVFGGVSYPLFWIDMAKEGDLAKLEDKFIFLRNAQSATYMHSANSFLTKLTRIHIHLLLFPK